MSTRTDHGGGCACGGVRYAISGPLSAVTACHCSICRRTSGHFAAMTAVPAAALTLLAEASLTWFRSSEAAERGFCGRCGGNLFWRPRSPDDQTIYVTAGTLDPPTGLRIGGHIFVADRSDYYRIPEDEPQSDGWS